MKLTDYSKDNRPRERLISQGAGILSTAELLAIVLKSGTKKENVLEMAQRLISRFGLEKLGGAGVRELQETHGIGQAKACQMVALFELGRRVPRRRIKGKVVRQARDVGLLYIEKMRHLKVEEFRVVLLDVKHKIIGENVLSKGGMDSSIVDVREVFHTAIKERACAVIVVHNHPSGDPTPSNEDFAVTSRLRKAGEIMGVELLDHIIVGDRAWFSFCEQSDVFS